MRKKKFPLHTKPKLVDRRLQLFVLGAIGVFCVLVFKLWTIQIYQQEKYEQHAKKNILRPIDILSERGRILDRNGKVLASDENFWDVWIPIKRTVRENGVYKNVISPSVKESLDILSDILNESNETLENRYAFGKRDSNYKQNRVRVASRIGWPQYVAIRERTIEFPPEAMVYTNPVPTRRYWYGEAGAHMLGYTGEVSARELQNPLYQTYRPGDRIGKTGIERQYETFLRGKDGVKIVQVDSNEVQQGQPVAITEAVPGHDVVLNIDKDLQQAAEAIMGASNGVMIAADPRDGAILAMAVSPRFNPQKPYEYMNASNNALFDKAIRGSFEPGSVFKVFEVLPLLEELKIDPTHTIFCGGVFTFGGNPWRCHQSGGHGHINMYEAVSKSCNVYFYDTVRRIGIERFYPWMVELGFDRPTGVDLPNEQIRRFPTATRQNWYPGDTINLSIGQGFLVLTPLQITTGLCAIANRGTVYQPQVARAIKKPQTDAVVQEFQPVVVNEIQCATETWDVLHQSMWNVVNAGGTGRRIVDPEIEIAGKSGTAQVAGTDETHAWFVCFAPYDEPEIAIACIVERAGHGGEVAAPKIKQLIDFYFGRIELADLGVRQPGSAGNVSNRVARRG